MDIEGASSSVFIVDETSLFQSITAGYAQADEDNMSCIMTETAERTHRSLGRQHDMTRHDSSILCFLLLI